jgi:hypothetical protein
MSTDTGTLVVAARVPESPVTVTVYDPGVVAACVFTVSVAVAGVVPAMAAGAVTEQVGAPTAPVGLPVTAQLSVTVPRKPPLGVTVIVEVPLTPGDAIVTPVLLSAKSGAATGAGTATAKLVVSLIPTETPVTVTVYDPGVVAACVFTVSVAVTGEVPAMAACAATEQVGASTAPEGPVTAHESVTVPVKPPLGVTVIVEVPLAPGEAMLTGVLVSEKLGGGGAFTVTVKPVPPTGAPLESNAPTPNMYVAGVVPDCV